LGLSNIFNKGDKGMAELSKLSKPIKVNGIEVSDLKYDVDEISPENFLEADARASTGLAAKGIQNMNLAEFNSALHFYLGCFAIIACDSSLDITDLLRVSGRDINKIRKIGQRFFGDTAAEESQEETVLTESPSEGSSGATVVSMENVPSLLDD
jgi:hypothetical protein